MDRDDGDRRIPSPIAASLANRRYDSTPLAAIRVGCLTVAIASNTVLPARRPRWPCSQFDIGRRHALLSHQSEVVDRSLYCHAVDIKCITDLSIAGVRTLVTKLANSVQIANMLRRIEYVEYRSMHHDCRIVFRLI